MSSIRDLHTTAGKSLGLLKLSIGLALFFLMLLINPFDMDPFPCNVLAVAVLMISWWITEALPMPVVALLPLVMFPLMGISTVSETAAPYANEVIFLFMGDSLLDWELKNGVCTNASH